jgi:ATP synthase F1 complex assembly factor 2
MLVIVRQTWNRLCHRQHHDCHHLVVNTMSTATSGDLKRFYRNVTYSETSNSHNETIYEINLDKRKLKTPMGKLFYTHNEQLANLIVHEWKTQAKTINRSAMHLTTLQNTCIDNPLNFNKDLIIRYLLEYLKTDTLLYRDEANSSLFKLQNEKWTPYVDWLNSVHTDLDLKLKYDFNATTSIADNTLHRPDSSLHAYLSTFNLNTLIALKYMCENLKSVILSMALLMRNERIGNITEICHLAQLEMNYQVDKWGLVEWHHPFEQNDILTRVCASYLFIYFNNNFHSFKLK